MNAIENRGALRISRRDFVQWLAATTVGASSVPWLQRAGADAPSLTLMSVLEDDGVAGAHDIEVRDGRAYVAGKTGRFAILDVSDAAHPSLLSTMSADEEPALGNAETVLLLGDTCLLGTDALLSIDISRPATPSIAHIVDDERVERINGTVRWGEHAIAVSKSGFLDVFNVSDPRVPSLMGVADTRKEGALRSPHDVARFGDRYLVVPSAGEDMPAYFGIYEVSREEGGLLPAGEWRCTGTISAPSLAGATILSASTCPSGALSNCSMPQGTPSSLLTRWSITGDICTLARCTTMTLRPRARMVRSPSSTYPIRRTFVL
jgi:hypothetical protein